MGSLWNVCLIGSTDNAIATRKTSLPAWPNVATFGLNSKASASNRHRHNGRNRRRKHQGSGWSLLTTGAGRRSLAGIPLFRVRLPAIGEDRLFGALVHDDDADAPVARTVRILFVMKYG